MILDQIFMKAGSLVECINNKDFPHKIKLNTVYVVSDIYDVGDYIETIPKDCYETSRPLLRVEECVMPNFKLDNATVINPPFFMDDFRELLPPLENIEETINENTLEYEKR